MERSYSAFTQSQFFNQAFNSAIYDGPIRIYFSQVHESAGLNVYFTLIKKHADSLKRLKELSKQSGENVFILIYPDSEQFMLSFDSHSTSAKGYDIASLDGHRIIGIKGPTELDEMDSIMEEIVEWTEALATTTANLRMAEL